ncbi:unnamed protein product [Rhizophagus irregularis]|nr:unnamed protein product [Rhizophagus irregularis]
MLNEITDSIDISEDDENFLINFLKDFHYKIIKENDFNNFEKNSSEWIKHILENNNKEPEKVLKMMINHKVSKYWFTSFMGFFYQFGIGCELDKGKSVELYLLAIGNNSEIKNDSLNEDFDFDQLNYDKDTFNYLTNKNIIIGKYLLSIFYYKDIILDINYKRNKLLSLEILTKNNDLEAQYNLAVCYQSGDGVKSNYRKAFELFLSAAKRGNLDAQYNLAICYMDGMGTQKDKKKAFKWFLKSESKQLITQNKGERKEFEKNLKLAIANDSKAQNYVGYCYNNGKVTNKNETKALKWNLL